MNGSRFFALSSLPAVIRSEVPVIYAKGIEKDVLHLVELLHELLRFLADPHYRVGLR